MANGVKITITLPTDQVDEIHGLIDAGKAVSVSGFVKHAVRIALDDAAGWREMLAEALLETGGPLTDAERAWADRMLAPPRKRVRARKRKAA